MNNVVGDGAGTPVSETTGVRPLWGLRLAAPLAPRSDHVRLGSADGLANGAPAPSETVLPSRGVI